MTAALLIDFGSTFTKLRAVDLDKAEIIGSGQGPSTVSTDVTEGLNAALKDLESQIGRASCRKECRSRWSPDH